MRAMKRIRTLVWIAAALSVTGVVWPQPARAQEHSEPLGEEWVPVGTERLDAMRGGFVVRSGLALSFGIERVAFVNGELVASSTLRIPDVANMTAEQAQALAALSRTQIVQVGEGNIVQPGAGAGLVIQNTLDGQAISALTTLDVSVNTLGLFQDLNIGAVLQDALKGAGASP